MIKSIVIIPIGVFFGILLIAYGNSDVLAIDDKYNCQSCHDGSQSQYRINEVAIESSAHRKLDCSSCHFDYVRPSNTNEPHTITSPLTKISEVENCSVCHQKQVIPYRESTHGQGLLEGDTNEPACTSCHSTDNNAHSVTNIGESDSPVFRKNIAQTCANCHDNNTLMAEYGVSTKVYETYENEFHGKAMKLSTDEQISQEIVPLSGILWTSGAKSYATCTSCHGTHDIIEADDPNSPTGNLDNLAENCQQCHTNANTEFASSYHMHRVADTSFWGVPIDTDEQLPASIVEVIYTRLIIPVMMLMGLSYIIQDGVRAIIAKRRHKKSLKK
jgi:hypothetical protein